MQGLFLSLATFAVFATQSSNAKISCLECPYTNLNLTVDIEISTVGCEVKENDLCSMMVNIDYQNSNMTYFTMGSIDDSMLLLTNGEPQLTVTTSIWFNQLRAQRAANVFCFSGSTCGLDLFKGVYKDQRKC